MPVPQDIGAFPNLRDIGELLIERFDVLYNQYEPIYPKYFSQKTGERYTETWVGQVSPTQMEQISFGQDTPFVDTLEGYKTTATAQKWARQIAKGMHTEEIATKIAEQWANPGRSAGSFNVEGASPGAGAGSPAQLPPELAGWAEGMPPEAVARAAERIRRNRGG